MKKIKFKTKSEFRAYAKDKLANVRHAYSRNKKMKNILFDLVCHTKVRSLLLYVSLPLEVDTNALIATCRRKKLKVYVPFMEGISFKMVRYRLPLYTKQFNIKEPKNSFAVNPKIDLAIVPVIGVDGALRRIGFGKGMYDRFFDTLDTKPTVVFVQRELCMTQTRLGEEHDIQADIYLTPYQIIIKRGHDGLRVTSSRCSSRKRRCRVFHRQKDGSGQL